VRLLIDAGASRDGVWMSGKPPSEDVIDVLRSYGITPIGHEVVPIQSRGDGSVVGREIQPRSTALVAVTCRRRPALRPCGTCPWREAELSPV